jgi:ABC-2 type transport system permease protein
MIKLYRIWAIMLRHSQQMFRDVSRLINIFYWPLLDILLMGYLGIWTQGTADQVHVAASLIGCLVLWSLVIRANYDIAWNALEELWSANMVNLFATPIKLSEWVIGSLCLAFILLLTVLSFLTVVTLLIYDFNILRLGPIVIPLALNMFMTGLSIGFFSAGILFWGGKRIEGLVFMIGYFLAPVSGAYYPLAVMPRWVQTMASILPMPYLFDTFRSILQTNSYDPRKLMIGTALNIFYFCTLLILFKWIFEKSREKGLARLAD